MNDTRFVVLAALIGINVAMACLKWNDVAAFNVGVAIFVALLFADMLFNKENGRWR